MDPNDPKFRRVEASLVEKLGMTLEAVRAHIIRGQAAQKNFQKELENS